MDPITVEQPCCHRYPSADIGGSLSATRSSGLESTNPEVQITNHGFCKSIRNRRPGCSQRRVAGPLSAAGARFQDTDFQGTHAFAPFAPGKSHSVAAVL